MDFPLQKIHCDLWGSAPIASHQNYRYYVLFVDDSIWFSWIFPLKRKSDFVPYFLKFQRKVENQLDRKIKVFKCDGCGEFQSTKFFNHLNLYGIVKQIS